MAADSGEYESIQRYIDMLEEKDAYTRGHSHHVMVVVEAIHATLPEAQRRSIPLSDLKNAALLHDIGKLFVPIEVLNKEGALDEREWEEMRRHPLRGKEFLADTPYAKLGDWILLHHERPDGRGYHGVPGDSVPLAARIIAVADTFSALRTYRIYRPAKSIDETVDILRRVSGAQLDAAVVECFLSLGREILRDLECNCEICRQRRELLEKTA
jgi:HD-GYP domain-containing protein (c-di-GMP phosphodiesterase class II)